MEQRDKRADAVGEQRVNQSVVKRDALLVDRADTRGRMRGQEREKR